MKSTAGSISLVFLILLICLDAGRVATAEDAGPQAPIVIRGDDVPLNAAGPERAVFDYRQVFVYSKGDKSLATGSIDKKFQATARPAGWSGNFARNPG
ncbi:MAG: hypothetical protein QF473_35930, partial [Planctomycetota bacterium]|nr:hypothetical protein [Planctomycetota bacterium]